MKTRCICCDKVLSYKDLQIDPEKIFCEKCFIEYQKILKDIG